jgi:hypothetical protein
MTQYARLQLFSKFVRYVILLATFAVALGLVAEYGYGLSQIDWAYGDSDYVFDVTPDYHQKYLDLKLLPGVNLWLLALYPLIILSAEFVILYWLQKLFSFYARGQFFHTDTTRCYTVLLWAFVFQFFFRVYEEYFLWLFYPDKHGIGINFHLDFGTSGMMLVLIVIVYVLKIANQIDKENKEFI